MSDKEFYRDKRETYIRVGLITIVGFLILFLGYGWMRHWFDHGRYTRLEVRFPSAGNIDPGDAVTLFGVRRGRVDRIVLSQTDVIIHLLVDLDFPLPADTRFLIRDADIMGNRQVDIIPGVSNETFQPGDVLTGQNLAGLSALIPKVASVVEEIDYIINRLSDQDELFDDLAETIRASRRMMSSIEHFLNDNQDELGGIVKNLHETTSELNKLFTQEGDNMHTTFQKVAKSVTELDSVLQRMNTMLVDIEPLVEKATSDEGTLHYLLTERDLYDKLLETTEQMDSLLIDIRENPRRYFKFSIF